MEGGNYLLLTVYMEVSRSTFDSKKLWKHKGTPKKKKIWKYLKVNSITVFFGV